VNRRAGRAERPAYGRPQVEDYQQIARCLPVNWQPSVKEQYGMENISKPRLEIAAEIVAGYPPNFGNFDSWATLTYYVRRWGWGSPIPAARLIAPTARRPSRLGRGRCLLKTLLFQILSLATFGLTALEGVMDGF
jgi:hypothetical protein